jgi:hypothetical protein
MAVTVSRAVPQSLEYIVGEAEEKGGGGIESGR